VAQMVTSSSRAVYPRGCVVERLFPECPRGAGGRANPINQEVVKGTSASGAEPLPSARQRARSAATAAMVLSSFPCSRAGAVATQESSTEGRPHTIAGSVSGSVPKIAQARAVPGTPRRHDVAGLNQCGAAPRREHEWGVRAPATSPLGLSRSAQGLALEGAVVRFSIAEHMVDDPSESFGDDASHRRLWLLLHCR
jgi:hypothetical protein